MASRKKLQEYLQEQQEPFMLHVYLAERGYTTKCSTLNSSNGCWLLDSRKRGLWKNPMKQIDISKSILFKSIVSKTLQRVMRENKPVDGLVSRFNFFEDGNIKQVDYPHCDDFDDGLILHHQQFFQLKNAEDKVYVEKKQCTTTCEIQKKRIIDIMSSKHKEITKSRPFDLQKAAWKLLENRILLKRIEEIPKVRDINSRNANQISSKNQKIFLKTKGQEKNREKTLDQKPEKMFQNMIILISNKVAFPEMIRNENIMNTASRIYNLHYVDVIENLKYSNMEECYREISIEIENVIMDDIVQEMIISSF